MDDVRSDGPPRRLGISGRIAAGFQRNAITPLLALVMLLLGVFSASITPREEEPQINVTMANVLIPFPGASAEDVEKLVASPAEQVLSQVTGIEHVFSVSRPGSAMVTIQFEVGVPRTEALVRLHDTILANRDWLPVGLGVGEPIVKPRGIDDVPIVAATLWAKDARAAESLERIARSIEHELKRVPGTREVKTIGGPGRAVHVWLDATRLRGAGLSVDALVRSLQGANLALPSGTLYTGEEAVVVETGDFLRSAEDVAELVIGANDGRPVHLRDVARIEYGAAPADRFVWTMPAAGAAIDKGAEVGRNYPAVTLSVTKKPGENAVSVSQAVLAQFDRLRNSMIPEDVELTLTRDYGETARDKADKLIQKLIFATLSVIVLVAVSLGWREALIVGGAVVLTLAATLFASWAWGFTLNRVSLFALIFSIGILVDDAIVVVENIHRHRQLTPGRPLFEIVPVAVDEVGGPTILATLTVIAALLPMAFVSGLMGPYMSPIPINSSMGMLLSLAIAFVVTPWLVLRLSSKKAPAHGGGADTHTARGVAGMLQRTFGALVRPFIEREPSARAPRWRRRLLGLGILAGLAASVALVGVQAVILKMLPFDNKSEFQLVVDMPAGTPVESTNAALLDLASALAAAPEVVHIQGYAGSASPITFNGLVRQYEFRQLSEQGDLQVGLVDKHHRKEQSHAIAQRLLPSLQQIAIRHQARLKLVEVPPGPPVMSPLVAEIYGPDAAGRAALARRLESALHEVPGLVSIDTSLEQGGKRLRLVTLKTRAAILGVSDSAVAQTARAALDGQDATYIHDGQAQLAIPVRIELPPEERGRLETLLSMPVGSASGKVIPLGELVRIEGDERDAPIHHKDLLPVVYVVGDMAAVAGNTIDSPLYGMFALRGRLAEVQLPDSGPLAEYFITAPTDPYRQYAIKWDGEWQITYETFRDMGMAYAFGLVLIYLLVVAQFRSYLTPLIIMAPIPLTIIGVMPGHALLGAQFTATSMIGMIALAGIIVRNSILLVDFIELEVTRGVPFGEAVIRSAQVRAQPILLTALAAMLGAFFILDDPIFNGLAVSLIFGILVSTLLTLVVIPVLYYVAWRRRHPAPGGTPPSVPIPSKEHLS